MEDGWMKNSFKKRYVLIPAVILALLLTGKFCFPLLLWVPTMNITAVVFWLGAHKLEGGSVAT